MYADIIIGLSSRQLDKTFQYRVPAGMEKDLYPGCVVNVPFGRGARQEKGYVVSFSHEPAIDPALIKDISGIELGKMPAQGRMIGIAAWMRDRYGGTLGRCIKTVMPVNKSVRKKEKKTLVVSPEKEKVEGYLERMKKKNAKARVRLLEAVIAAGSLDYDTARKECGITSKTVAELEMSGVINIESNISFRNPAAYKKSDDKHLHRISLNEAQQKVVDTVVTDFSSGIRLTYLLHGVTGSGKTLCYIEIIDAVVKSGKQAIVLIPEIALTMQTVSRFRERFGDRVSIMNSRMSKGERHDQFIRAANGDIDVMIGPRSALFTPFDELGIIVIDEEHEESYKSENVPKYHARDVAVYMAGKENASIVLGSATPSLESYYRAKNGEYRLLSLKDRAAGQSMPEVYIEDMRQELRAGNKQIFSRRLMSAINKRLQAGEQTMLFINKRGFAGFISCRSCGHVFKCPHCDISKTYHKNNNKLICHYCGHEEEMPGVCPVCGSPYIASLRAGTQQIEEKVKKLFPGAVTLRMDRDTTSGKEGHTKVLSEFSEGKADILIGTQMIVKGHDFPNVTLVAAIMADMSLNTGDYKATERTFQLLAQAAGRAGRGSKPGEMFIQTYMPEAYSLTYAAKHDYEGFYREEMEFRHMMCYPPVWHMLIVQFLNRDAEMLKKAIDSLSLAVQSPTGVLFAGGPQAGAVQVLGPSKDGIYKLDDEYRFVMYIKGEKDEDISGFKKKIEKFVSSDPLFSQIIVQFDRA